MDEGIVNNTTTRHKFSFKNKIKRALWGVVYIFLFKPFKLRVFKKWRVFILRLFGAQISWNAMVNSSVKIWAPWNLKMGAYSCLGPKVDCYNQGMIKIGSDVTISQKTYLCASSHDFTSLNHELFLAPIIIEDKVWVAADAFIGPGVTIKQGSVIGARSAVFKNVEEWTVIGGNPAKFIKKRELK
ncbi:putative colanic acid biosynthesis acetyltransferase [Wenyingzhuangia sp. chi5]|uniref:Colanic acid biosynthesis acetyltransferase n=1 Tax=Wenyingzhuangia gilva TaxID=3057677 RepID=A0ABT8VNS7_9FLAO|nr:putative colanic acid biosynthesis acetyltransferase [Wenyingzhuangia sp. chi5]MDO3693626.1 putative colanic acid biosynthesis acetyltransferase [Wenyingzhuangia sp. chi5]